MVALVVLMETVVILPVACPLSVVLSGYAGCPTTETGRHNIAVILLKVALNG
jgi:hypothetical protein